VRQAPEVRQRDTLPRVCRVVVDVLAVERLFDYLVPEGLAGAVEVGTVVRVPLHGRRVRAWVVADGVDSVAPPSRIRSLLGVVSAGPPPDVVDLIVWTARRFAGPRLPLLRAASPPAVVLPATAPLALAPSPLAVGLSEGADPEAAALAAEAHRAGAADRSVTVIRWPPASDLGDLVAGLLPEHGSCLVVVPDGRLPSLLSRLRAAGRVAVPYLSDGRPSDRARAWDRARRGACVVMGGRRAVFAPVPDLAAVVVLDDGVEALKEERSPAWHARDVAVERARRAGARVTLVSPVPPLESITAASVLVPSRSAERAGWPVLEVVDRRREPPGLGLFSTRLVAALRAAVSGVGRAVCVLNRRGRARLLACHACGELARCERCQAAVGEPPGEPAGTTLVCSACGHGRPRLCARCGGTRLRILRAGVSRVREELSALLPGVDVAMVDAGTDKIAGEPVLIGTEAVLHRAEAARLVAFLDFDQELLAPRFRAGEQALWLLVRAARLVGPRSGGGRMLVQTRLPRHEVLEAAVRADPGLLSAAEEPRRRLLKLPPYSALGALTGDRPALDAASVALRQTGVQVSDSGRAGLLVRAPTPEALADALAEALAAGRPAGRLRAEVDPLRA
jgi:primosomal protein N' (replication factor Y) (superfamily II helicase)